MDKIVICTDGACRGNGKTVNIGAYACVLEYKGKRKEFSGVELNTTNNRMELMGCIKGLEYIKNIKNTPIAIMTDSAYLYNMMAENYAREVWAKRGWITSTKQPVKNKELWQQLLALTEDKTIEWIKVEGHSGHELNELADQLCNQVMNKYVKGV